MSKINSQNIGMIGKMIIPEAIEEYINTLHSEVGNTEWSGILFYKLTKGNIKQFKNLEFTVEFIYPMNIGSSTYTEFEYNNHVMNAYDIKDDLIECSNSLIHSHHSMGTFFSGTDNDELLSNCTNFNYYISLIVNFAKNYNCKIAFPSKSTINKKHQIKDQNGKLITFTSKSEIDNILIGDLDIVLESGNTPQPWLLERITELKKTKAATKNVVKTYAPDTTYGTRYGNTYSDLDGWDNYGSPTITKAAIKITPLQFATSLINLDVSKKSKSLYTSLNEIKNVTGSDLDIYEGALELNIEIIYANLFPEDSMFRGMDDICIEALSEINKFKSFKDESATLIVKSILKTYVY